MMSKTLYIQPEVTNQQQRTDNHRYQKSDAGNWCAICGCFHYGEEKEQEEKVKEPKATEPVEMHNA